jgi:hypothetical protein
MHRPRFDASGDPPDGDETPLTLSSISSVARPRPGRAKHSKIAARRRLGNATCGLWTTATPWPTAGFGPDRQFAAARRSVGCQRRTGRSADRAASPSPTRTPYVHRSIPSPIPPPPSSRLRSSGPGANRGAVAARPGRFCKALLTGTSKRIYGDCGSNITAIGGSEAYDFPKESTVLERLP